MIDVKRHHHDSPPDPSASSQSSAHHDGADTSWSKEVPPDEHVKRYILFRDKIRDENELTNQRLNWSFLVQGFLFTAWAVCVSTMGSLKTARASANLCTSPCNDITKTISDLHGVAITIGWTGIAVSVLIFLGALAAQLAIVTIQGYWYKKNTDYRHNLPWLGIPWLSNRDPSMPRKWNTHGNYLPGLLGGGRPLTHLLGGVAPLLIPIVVVVAWGCVLHNTPGDQPGSNAGECVSRPTDAAVDALPKPPQPSEQTASQTKSRKKRARQRRSLSQAQ